MQRTIVPTLSVCITVMWLQSSAAHACSCTDPPMLLVPVDQATHPANGRLVVSEDCRDASDSIGIYTVTVDGSPAQLILDPTWSAGGWEVAATMHIEPTPAADQEVIVTSCETPVDTGDGSWACPPGSASIEVARYTTGAEDHEPPSASASLAFEVIESGLPYECDEGGVRFEVELGDLQLGTETTMLRVHVSAPDGSGAWSEIELLDPGESRMQVSTARSAEFLTADAQDYCVAVSVSDLAGNEVELAQRCGPPMGSDSPDPGASPTEDDAVAGCTVGDADEFGAPSFALALVVVGLTVARRRRR